MFGNSRKSRTSCKCSNCCIEEGKCENYRSGPNPRQYKKPLAERDIIVRNGILVCKKCKALWNRDENSARNIYKIAKCAITGLSRPEYLCRQKKKDTTLLNEVKTKKVKTKKEKSVTLLRRIIRPATSAVSV